LALTSDTVCVSAGGVGFVVNIDGTVTHTVIRQGIQVVENLVHRGACGCDPETGDGAGMIVQLPHRFFVPQVETLKFALPGPGAYAVGMVFLPTVAKDRRVCMKLIEKAIHEEGQTLLGWEVAGPEIIAKNKSVIVIGGGDTGSDCVGAGIRQGAKQVVSLEILPRPPFERDETTPWSLWPYILRTSSSHEEGGIREWSVLTKKFTGENGHVKELHCVRVQWIKDESGRTKMQEIPGTEFTLDADLVLLALGFLHPEHDSVLKDLGLELDPRGNIKTGPDYQSSRKNVFAAGDARRGQSLVVWAIREGREAARCIDLALMGRSNLPSISSYGYDSLGRGSTSSCGAGT
jgi:hypothetical protein